MPIPHTGGTAFTTHTCTGSHIEYPFRDLGDGATKVYHHAMLGSLSSYAPLSDDDEMTAADEKPTGSPFSDDANAFYVGDSPTVEQDGGLVSYDRMFANVPADRIDPLGLYAVTRPGIVHTAGSSLSAVWYAASTSKSFTNSPSPTLTITVSATRSGNYEVGDTVQCQNAQNWDITAGSSQTVSIMRGVIATKSTHTFTVNTLSAPGGNTVTNIASDNSSTGYDLGLNLRDIEPASINAASFMSVSYVKTDTPEDVALENKPTFFASNKNITLLLNNFSVPTISQFLDDSQDLVNKGLEAETIKQWRGNIYEKTQIKGRYPLMNV